MPRTILTSPDGTLPRELARSKPRSVRLSPEGKAVSVCAPALLAGAVVAAALMSAAAGRDAELDRLFESEGRTTTAAVTAVRRSREKRPQATIDYRYTAGGEEYSNRVKLRKRDPLGQRVQPGSRIAVRYLRSRPEESWVEGSRPGAFPLALVVVVPLGMLLGAVAIWIAVQRQRQLLADGRAAMARITGTRKTDYGYRKHWRVDYEWRLLSGGIRRGHFKAEKTPPAVGTFVPIVYDPDEPRRHSRYPLSLVRVQPPGRL